MSEPFEFSLFGEAIDEMEMVVEPKKKEVNKKEIDELLEFIGGFEKWTELIEDCRIEVVKFLDYKTRCNLALCSKMDYVIVEKTPICVNSVEIKDHEKDHYMLRTGEYDNVEVQVQFNHDYKTGKKITCVFSQFGNDTHIQWLQFVPTNRPRPRNMIWKDCNYYDSAVKFAEKWMKKGNFEINSISVEMSKYPFETSLIKTLPRCKGIRIAADDMDTINWWFNKLPEEINDLDLSTYSANRDIFTLPSEFLNAPQVMQVPKFYFSCRAAFSNEQFLTLKANSMSFDSVDVTDDGINKFIKNWVKGKGVDGFKDVHLWSTQHRDPAALTSGIEVREWDDGFEDEAAGFCDDFKRCCGRGFACFQIKSRINPYESLTMSVDDDRVSIYATGKAGEYEGKIYTYYSIP